MKQFTTLEELKLFLEAGGAARLVGCDRVYVDQMTIGTYKIFKIIKNIMYLYAVGTTFNLLYYDFLFAIMGRNQMTANDIREIEEKIQKYNKLILFL